MCCEVDEKKVVEFGVLGGVDGCLKQLTVIFRSSSYETNVRKVKHSRINCTSDDQQKYSANNLRFKIKTSKKIPRKAGPVRDSITEEWVMWLHGERQIF